MGACHTSGGRRGMSDWQHYGLVAFLVSLCFCALIARFGAKDAPDGGRKDHARPTATLGGLGIAAGFYASLALGAYWRGSDSIVEGISLSVPAEDHLILFGFAIVFLIIGLVDDLRPMPARVKLVLLMVTSAAACGAGWHVYALESRADVSAFTLFALVAGGTLWVFVLTNATNFMDGANGIAMGSAAIMFLALGAILEPMTELVGAIAGFLVLNLFGRLFAGDTGALFVGFLLSAFSLLGAYWGLYSIWLPPLIALPFLTDIILTILWRARRGGNILQAHNDHAYQLLRRAGWSHIEVAALWWMMSAICGGLAVYAYIWLSVPEQLLLFLVAVFISTILWTVHRILHMRAASSPG